MSPGCSATPGRRHGVAGPAPEHASYGSFVAFEDPGGSGGVTQEITARLPGR
ncbi:MAG TPA: hypothetical protein VHN16_03430 [Streptosporangiaceae bacterium]|nr:hypothetical protein [Streptosporangiaceae bacterium]